jgi:autotransporter-associated beta strand protein
MPFSIARHLSRTSPSVFRLAVAVVAAALSAGRADAQTYAWTQPDSGTSANWSAGPWSPGTPVSGTSTVLEFNAFGGAGAYTFTNDIGAFTLNGMNLNNWGTNLLTLSLAGSNTLTFDGTSPFLNNNGPGNVTISGTGGVSLSTATAVTGAGNGTVTVSSVVSGAGGLNINQTGLGVFSLTGANTFTGGVTLTSGILSLGNATALGAAANTLTVNGGAVRFSSFVTIANNITANTDLVVAGGTSTPTLTGVISGSGGLRLQNYNTTAGLTLQGANTYTGPTTLQSFIPTSGQSGPILTLSGPNGSILSTNTSPITIGKNATLQLNNATGSDNSNRVPAGAPIFLNTGRITFTGISTTNQALGNVTITGAAGLTTSASSGVPALSFGTLTRLDNAGLNLSSTSVGALSGAATYTTVTFAGGLPTLSAGPATQIGIVPFATGGSLTNPRNLVTYDSTNGLSVLPYTNGAYFAQVNSSSDLLAAADQNVTIATSTTYDLGGAMLRINALSNSVTGGATFQNGTLQVYSGAILNWDPVVWNNITLDFGPRTGYISASWFQSFKGTSQITGSAGVVLYGGGSGSTYTVTFENTAGNPFTGGLFINGNTNVGFRQDNQLGAAGGSITLGGGMLSYNAAADLTISRPIKINESNGGVTFNVVASNGTAGNATATTTLTLSGPITGNGAFIKEGIGIVLLTGTNTYAGGTVVSAGTLQFNTAANLGSGAITLNGGTLQPLADGTVANPVQVNAPSTILTSANLTLSSPLTTVGQLYGTANPTLTKAGAGTLTLTAASPNLSGPVSITAGTLALAGAGTAPQVSSFTLPVGTALVLDNSAAYVANRLGNRTRLNVTGGTVNYIAGSTATADPAARFGPLTASAAAGRINVDASLATTPTVLHFASLTPITTGSLLFSGTNLGGASGNYTRILFDTPPPLTAANTLPNAFFSNVSMGASQGAAAYDPVLGVILFNSPPASGTLIDNYAPTSTPTTATYTTTGAATANTGAVVFDLILDGGGVNLVNGPNGPSGTNNNTPTGTLAIGNSITSQNGAKQITADAGTTNPTVAFGTSVARFLTTSDLTIASPVAVSGSSGLEKTGAGTLTFNGSVAITGSPMTVLAGTLTFGPTSTIASGASVTLANPGTVVNFNGTTAPTLGTLTVGAQTTANLNQNVTAASVPGSGSLVFASGTTLTVTGAAAAVGATLSGQGALVYNPTAVSLLTLNGNNTFTGGVSGNANARFAITNPAGFGTGTVNASAQTASSNATTPTVGFNFGTNGSGTVPNNFVLSATSGINSFFSTLTSAGQTATLTGVISGGNAGSGLNVGAFSTTNVLVLANPANTFQGTVTVQTGALAITADGALGNVNNGLTLQGGSPTNGSLRFDANNITLADARTVNITGTSYINTNGFNATIAGQFLGLNSITLNKIGAGTLALTLPPNTFSFAGPVNVNGGTLLVNGDLPGSAGGGVATVNSGGTLGGSGSVGTSSAFRNVTVASGGTVAGGNPNAAVGTSPGNLTVDGDLTFAAGSNFRVRITGGSPAAANSGGSSGGGANNGFLTQRADLGGNLNFDPAAKVVIDGTGFTFIQGQAYSYAVASYQFGSTGLPITDPTRFQTVGFIATNISLIDGGGTLYLNFTPVPEPAAAFGLAVTGLGFAGWVCRIRRRAPRAVRAGHGEPGECPGVAGA